MKCNCSICENHEYSTKNRMTFNELKEYIREDKKILDNRRSIITRYNYCPFCGKKIDWKYIVKSIIS